MDILFDDAHGQRQKLDIVSRKPEIVFDIDGERLSLTDHASNEPARVCLKMDGRLVEGWRWVAGNDIYLRLEGRHWHFRRAGIEAGESSSSAARSDLRAEMPGTVVTLHVSVGVEVAEGDRLLTIESMKLQMILTASRGGRIKAIHVEENSSFDRGATLVSFDSDSETGTQQSRTA